MLKCGQKTNSKTIFSKHFSMKNIKLFNFLGQNFAKISHKTNKSPISISLAQKWWKEANLPSRVVENGFRRIYNSREFQAKKSLGTLCRATLVKLQFFLTLLLQKVFVQMMMRGGGGKKELSLFQAIQSSKTLAWKAQEKGPIGTLCCWSVGGSCVQMEWSGKLRLSTLQVHDRSSAPPAKAS